VSKVNSIKAEWHFGPTAQNKKCSTLHRAQQAGALKDDPGSVFDTISLLHKTAICSGIIKMCSPVKVNRRFGETYRFHVQSRISQAINQQN
jgi:hypothetical protein